MRRPPRLVPLLCCASLACVAAAAQDPAPAGADDPGTELTHAYYTRGCGPVDQPVTMIYLTRDPVDDDGPRAPYVQLWFAGGLDEHGRFEGRWNGAQGDIGGTWCRTGADCNPILRGYLKLARSTSEGTLNGDIELELDGPVGGPLRALPLPAERLSCG